MAEKTVSVRLIARVGQYASEMNQAAGATSQFGNQLTGTAGKAQGAVTKLGAAAALAGKVTLLGIGAAMVVSAKAAIDFESSLTGVAKTTDLAGGALTNFGRQIRDLSLDIPVNVNELNRIAELGGQLGIQTPALIGFTDTIAKLGVTTNLATEEAATGLARFMNIMGSEQGDISRFGSVLVELGNNFATTEQDILNFALRLAPMGQAVGISEAGVFALGASLSSLGITAERGGTAMQRIFLDMQDAVQSNSDELSNWAQVAGVSTEEFSQAFQRDPMEALLLVAQGLDTVVDSGGNVFETLRSINISEQRAIGVALALANGNEILADAYGMANGQIEENNALNEEAALRFGTTESQISLVANAFNDLRIEAGQAFLETGFLAGFLAGMKELLIIMRDNIDVIGRFAAVLAGLSLLALGQFFGGIIVGAVQSAGALLRTASAAQGLSRGMLILRGTSLALNAAFGVVGIAAVVMGTIWANQARKAAQLKAAVAELNSEIEAGADPIDALTAKLTEALDPRTVTHIQNTGMTMREFTEDILAGGGAAGEILGDLQSQIQTLPGAAMRQSIIDPEAMQIFRDLNEAIPETAMLFDAFREQQLNTFVDEFRTLNPETKLTAEQIRAMGARIQELRGADLSGWAERQTAALNFIDPAARAAAGGTAELTEATEEIAPSFIESLLALEGGADIYADFTESVSDVVQDFRDTIGEAFERVTESILEAKPAWDEYGEAVEINVGKIIAAREAFLVDLGKWVDIQPALLAQASQATLDEIDAWTLQEKAAFAGLSEQRRTVLIEGMNRTNDEQAVLMGEFWGTRLPGEVERAIPGLLSAIGEIAAQIEAENPGMDAGDAWVAGVEQVITEFSDDPIIKDTLMALLTDPSMLSSTHTWASGIGWQIWLGLQFQLSQIGDRAVAVWNAQMERLKEGATGAHSTLEITSPSKWAMRMGAFVGEGFVIGLQQSLSGNRLGMDVGANMQAVSRSAFLPATAVSSATHTSSTSTTYGGTNITIPIINPESKDLNRAVDKARNKINAIVPLVEGRFRIQG